MSRDYKAEYRKRIERLTAEGYSKSQARGHAKKREIQTKEGPRTVRIEKPISVERVRERVLTSRDRAFGGASPKRQRGETAIAYEDRIADLRVYPEQESFDYGDSDRDVDYDAHDEGYEADGDYSWDDKEAFLDEMRDEGLSEHDAHDLWFGY